MVQPSGRMVGGVSLGSRGSRTRKHMQVTEQPNDAMAGRPSPSHGSSNYEHFCRISVDRAANSGAYDPKGHVVPG